MQIQNLFLPDKTNLTSGHKMEFIFRYNTYIRRRGWLAQMGEHLPINLAIRVQFRQHMKIFFHTVAIKRCVTSTFSNYSDEWNAINWNNKKADFTCSI